MHGERFGRLADATADEVAAGHPEGSGSKRDMSLTVVKGHRESAEC
jgi:hypothetical protein